MKVCPKCRQSANVVKIVYGKPSQELIDEAEKELVSLGGCSRSV